VIKEINERKCTGCKFVALLCKRISILLFNDDDDDDDHHNNNNKTNATA